MREAGAQEGREESGALGTAFFANPSGYRFVSRRANHATMVSPCPRHDLGLGQIARTGRTRPGDRPTPGSDAGLGACDCRPLGLHHDRLELDLPFPFTPPLCPLTLTWSLLLSRPETRCYSVSHGELAELRTGSEPRSGHTFTNVGNKNILFGGFGRKNGVASTFSDVWMLDIQSPDLLVWNESKPPASPYGRCPCRGPPHRRSSRQQAFDLWRDQHQDEVRRRVDP